MKDEEWLRRSFLISQNGYDEVDSLRREFTTANYKFTDTTLGGSFAINPPPQFTRYADLRVKGVYSKSEGMGRYYSEALDDRGQYVHMRFGVPEFNSMTNFWLNFHNVNAASLANRGRGNSVFFNIGAAGGAIVSLPVKPLIWFGKILRYFSNKPASKFYYLKPTMSLYWSAVGNIANAVGVNMGVIGRATTEAEETLSDDKAESGEGSALYDNLSGAEYFPNIYRDDGGIDVYAMATRAQRLMIAQQKAMNDALEGAGSTSEAASAISGVASSELDDPLMNYSDIESYRDAYFGLKQGELESKPEEGDGSNKETNADEVDPQSSVTHSKLGDADMGDYLQAELEDGAAFITLRVDQQDTVSESFSNSVGESAVQGTINQISSTGRQVNFSLSGGNIGDGVISETVEKAYTAVADTVKGIAHGVGLDGLFALGGAAFVDIPKVWDSSTASLPKASYTIELRSPYGNPMSRFQNLILPLSMILAGALPLSTGKQSYTSPFLCELYSQGRQQIRLGMIDSLSITRGAGNIGWTANGEPLGIDVSLSVVDMSSILAMPIESSFGAFGAASFGAGEIISGIAGWLGASESQQVEMMEVMALLKSSTWDDDNPFTDYMAVLGSLSLTDQIYPQNKLRLAKARTMANWEQWKSPAHLTSWLGDTGIGRRLKLIVAGSGRE